MKHIWAPWRIQYILEEKPGGCILCDKPKEDKDVQNYILYRGGKNFIMMNSYPYNPGHLLVAPYRHTANLEELTEEERNEHFELISRSIRVLKEAFQPGGFNIGANIGKVAGAGIDDHFHSHIVPRWQGDTNFIPVLSDIRVVPQALADTYKTLEGKF
ncbi:MAG TPA: HIT domain-containing protein [Dehalococcoidales bacterium]|nr:HIT domain-containing protein [Dehalococcoidales bacterium]